jgi:hypothetical protein
MRIGLALLLFAVPSTAIEAHDVSREPKADEVGTICYADGTSRRLTPDNALWLARMVDGETWGDPSAADASAMLWSLAQRSGIWGFPKWDFSEFVWSYSQPISPKWLSTGSACKKYYAADYTGSIPDNCSVKRTTRRAANRTRAWKDIDVVARQAVLEFVAGEMPNPVPGSVGWWASGTWDARVKKGNQGDEVLHARIDGNAYIELSSNPDTRSWTADRVKVVGAGQSCSTATKGGTSSAPPKKPKPKLGSCADDFGYHKAGKISSWTTGAGGNIATLEIESAGWADRVCDDSSGMIYMGAKDDQYVQDGTGQKIRFAATTVDESRTVVEITHGTLTPAMLEGNRRVVLRKKK